MAENSAIEWCDHTFNPWWGCVKVSPGCKNCYAAEGRGSPYWGPDAPRRFMKDSTWENPLKWDEKAERLGIRYKVFCGSMCDVFEDREDLIEPRDKLFQLIDATPYLDWQLLTKRPENIRRLWPFGYYDDQFSWPNIWLGASIENQEQADIRIPQLLKIPAKVRFQSCEPLLEEIEFFRVHANPFGKELTYSGLMVHINWVIVGGESGPRKRPFNPDWARSIRDQCKEANIPFFMKQIDKVKPIPDDLMIRKFPDV
jgi:protein gp37